MQIVNALFTLGLGKPKENVDQLHLSSRVQPLGCSTETRFAQKGEVAFLILLLAPRDCHSKLDEVNQG
jgi:hypothetical protein